VTCTSTSRTLLTPSIGREGEEWATEFPQPAATGSPNLVAAGRGANRPFQMDRFGLSHAREHLFDRQTHAGEALAGDDP
jgi:hypothetical protein